jgi:hypothetical protein
MQISRGVSIIPIPRNTCRNFSRADIVIPISIALEYQRAGMLVPRNTLGLGNRYTGIPRADCDAKQIVSTTNLERQNARKGAQEGAMGRGLISTGLRDQ